MNILYSDNQLSACNGALFLLKTKIQKVVQSVILIPFHIFSGTCWDGGGGGNLIQNSYEGGVVVMFIHGGILFPHLFQHTSVLAAALNLVDRITSNSSRALALDVYSIDSIVF